MRFTLIICLLAACTRPDLPPAPTDAAVQSAPYPKLIPLDQLISGEPAQITLDTAASLEARLAALKARAARLRAMRF
jgi:hypothetical protein